MNFKNTTFVSRDFYLRYGKKILCIVILLVLYIDLRYECEEAIYRIDKLKIELKDRRYTYIARWGELTGKNKPEIIRRKVSDNHVNLITSDEPATIID